MASWWEYDSGPAIKVPEPEHDERPGMAFACWAAGVVALIVAVLALLVRAWSVSWTALAVMGACIVLASVLLPKPKAPK